MAHDVMQIIDVTLSVLFVVFGLGAVIWVWNEWGNHKDRKP